MPPDNEEQHARCPSCGCILERLMFHRDMEGRQYGSVALPMRDHPYEIDEDDITGTGDHTYTCPECDHEFSDEEVDQIEEDAIEEDAAARSEGRHGRRERSDGEGNHVSQATHHRRFRSQDELPIAECPHCGHVYQDEPAAEMICPRCNETWHQEIPEQEAADTRQNRPRNVNSRTAQALGVGPRFIARPANLRLRGRQ